MLTRSFHNWLTSAHISVKPTGSKPASPGSVPGRKWYFTVSHKFMEAICRQLVQTKYEQNLGLDLDYVCHAVFCHTRQCFGLLKKWYRFWLSIQRDERSGGLCTRCSECSSRANQGNDDRDAHHFRWNSLTSLITPNSNVKPLQPMSNSSRLGMGVGGLIILDYTPEVSPRGINNPWNCF